MSARRANGCILEYLDTGRSSTVTKAVDESGQAGLVAARRALRGDFISQATAEAVLAVPSHGLVTLDDYRGDFQMHSTWSDGGQTLERIVEGARALGHTCAGVTDHGYGLPIASGMSMEAVSRQHAGDRRAQRAPPRRVPAVQGHRSQHPRRRADRHGAWRAAPFRVRRRLAALGAAQPRRPDRADGRRGVAAVRGHPRPSARAALRRAPRRVGRLGQVFATRPNAGSRSRSTAIPIGRTSIGRSRRPPSTRDASSRSTATRTRPRSCCSRAWPSPTRGWPGFRRSGSSTAGRTNGSRSG